ncbi:MAG: dethiobiotin synthase [Deltaproteobacteria bacterium]|nr:dethiobiotin synthase [Deltaproteobacteria bacterium]
MSAPLVVVSGTGTEIGKTHVATALLLAWRRRDPAARLAGLKPVESGVVDGVAEDGRTLEQASTFHVKRFRAPYLLARAVSPHLAARDEGVAVELPPIVAYVEAVRAEADGVLVELAGGLFSPLSATLSNLDVADALRPTVHILVAPDRLGVLHDVAAAVRAARATRTRYAPTGIVLVAPARPDLSTGTNADELRMVTDLPVVAVVPRGTHEACAEHLGGALP